MEMRIANLRMTLRSAVARMRAWIGRSDGAHNKNARVEFKDVFDQVLEEGDWVGLSAGALERSWRTPRAKV